MDNLSNYPSLLQPLQWLGATANNIRTDILRLDQLHPVISGNKWFKLKGHLQEALQSSGNRIITFGGPWSNHLIATAYAARQAGLAATGIVRGEKPPMLSATLTAAMEYGMQMEFVSRREYREKNEPGFLNRLTDRYPGAYIIPEGGAGLTGILGSEDILRSIDAGKYTHIGCAIGTGTMFLGLVRASVPGQLVIGVPVLKGVDQLSALEPGSLLSPEQSARTCFLTGYHFGGYARHPPELLNFMNDFYRETGVPSDIVYTGKLFYAIRDSIIKDHFPKTAHLLVIHSGGLQGNLSLPAGILNF
jgi:1-aminocyclopropane-1-carboxylate deaminase/D-cysteine desulfhydrase-like pyridoxal-dependent ACC family enzyme